MIDSATLAAAVSAELAPAPIPRQWILRGSPEAKSVELVRSRDGTASVWVWECSPGEFAWHCYIDETIYLVRGEVWLTSADNRRQLLKPGQVMHFPAGSSFTWRVLKPVRKIAFLRHDLPKPVGFGLRAWHRLLQLAGIRKGSGAL
jgi:uncharacterized cupin superfamily protein